MVAGQGFLKDDNLCYGGGKGEEILVRLNDECRGNWQNLLRDLGSERHPASPQIALAQAKDASCIKRVKLQAFGSLWSDYSFEAIGKQFSNSVAYQANRPVLGHDTGYTAEFPRQPPVVAVQESDDFATALGDTCVESRSLTTIRLSKEAHSRFELPDDVSCSIRRSVIDHQDIAFAGRKILLEDACDRSLDEAFVVEGVNQYTDKWSQHDGQFGGLLTV